MAGTFIPTSTYSNITRLELEQLRRADFAAGGKALTVGDSGLSPEGVVGPGSIGAEPFYTGPPVNLDDVYPITLPTTPGPGLLTTTSTQGLVSDVARWYGPTLIYSSGASGFATGAHTWTDLSVISFVGLGVQAGDILVIKSTSGTFTDLNQNTVGTVSVVAPTALTVTNIWNPNTGTAIFSAAVGDKYQYFILRPQAIQLFAVPGSGPVGEEQTFMMVTPGATIHSLLSPTQAQIEAARVKDVVRPNASSGVTVDRSDFVYDFIAGGGASRTVLEASLLTLGYRVVLYPSNALGTGPDLTNPIATVNPIIDPAIPLNDQRMTIDYKAGIVRFSCAPKVGGQIKVAGGVHPTTGRLQLYAIFWAVDLTLTQGNARGLYQPRSSITKALPPAKIRFVPSPVPTWRVGSNALGTEFFVKSTDTPEAVLQSGGYPFLGLGDRASTEFGVVDSSLKYFSYRRNTHEWRFKGTDSSFASYFGPTDEEMFVADKTDFTVAAQGSPGSHAANLNPSDTYGGVPSGLRSYANSTLFTDLASSLAKTPYGTIHLKKGRYYLQDAIFVPPGTTIEGEGPGTKIIYRNFNGVASSARARAGIQVGPNTTWGVWDASAYPNDSSPYKTDTSPWSLDTSNRTIEGLDTVWNPVRRVWAVVYADVTANSIFFNEIREDGTSVWSGSGVQVKDNATSLFVQQPGQQHHSGGHYPRIAYHEHANEYAVVWVQQKTVGPLVGGEVCLRYVKVEPTMDRTVAEGWEVNFPHGASLVLSGDYTFADHPSVAVEQYTTSPTQYTTCVVFWTYDRDAQGNPTSSRVNRRYIKNNAVVLSTFSSPGTSGKEVVSSTDVQADAAGGFLSIWSVRPHPLYKGTNGQITIAGNSVLTDPSVPNWSSAGVVEGSKFHCIVSPGFPTVQQGTSGVVVAAPGGPNLTVKWEGGLDFQADGPGVVWAVSPPSFIRGRRSRLVLGVEVEDSSDTLIVQYFSGGGYHLELREPDFVRLSRGSANWCVVFQGFNTHAGPSYPYSYNYEYGHTAGPPTYPNIPMGDTEVYREHISTCSVILRDDGNVIYPTQQSVVGSYTSSVIISGVPQTDGRMERDLEVSLKSLGGRPPITTRPNYQSLAAGSRIPVNYTREVSLHNYSYRWTTDGVKACIPDVSWTGQDWVAVSPAKHEIHSFTGAYAPTGPNCYLSDALFYFGLDAPGTTNFGWHLRQTLPSPAYIYFPSSGTTHLIVSVVDEHTVLIGGNPLGGGSITNVEWFLLYQAPGTAGVKNQGFRIGSDGKLITSTSYVTWADQPYDTDTDPLKRDVELMRRPQTRGGNYPSQVAGSLAGESADALSPGSRYKANINFRGVAPGRPKGMSRLASVESPIAAIAWSDNVYGLFDRTNEEDNFAPTRQIEFYRQTFGPYNVTLRNFQVEATASTALEVRSYSHVYTRHLAPVSTNLSFDTDGFRNVFVYPTSRVFSPYGSMAGFSSHPVTSYIGAVYTNAMGHDPIHKDGPTLARGDVSLWCSDLSWETIAPTWVSSFNDQHRYIAPGTGPKVLWDGQRFAIFWIERANDPYNNTPVSAGAVGYLLCMSYLPGDEDAGLQTTELVNPYEALDSAVLRLPLSSVHISDGSGVGSGPGLGPVVLSNTVAVCEAAFSGKVYAVVWAAGLAPNYVDPDMSTGSTLGVTLFNMDSAVPSYFDPFLGTNRTGGGTTYVIEQSSEGSTFHNPKIVWDGARFVIFYQIVTPTTSTWSTSPPSTLTGGVAVAYVPEDGLARPTQTKQIASPLLKKGTAYPTPYPGSGGPFSTIPWETALGSAAFLETFPAGSPHYGANCTYIQLYGNLVTPAIVPASVTGNTTALSYLFNDATKNFYTLGVRPGDYIIITVGVDAGVWLIQGINLATQLEVYSKYSQFVGGAGQTYTIVRYQQPNVQPGDMLVVQQVNDGVTSSTKSNGVYPVINYIPQHHTLVVEGKFDAGDIDDKLSKFIYGEIRSGGVADYDNGGSLESTRTGINPRSWLAQNAQWGTGANPSVARLHGVAYNDVDDEFAAFVQHSDARSAVYSYNAGTRSVVPEVWLSDISLDRVYGAGDIAWNGSHYLIAFPNFTTATTSWSLRARLLNARFSEEATLTLLPDYTTPGNPDFPFGNGVGQIPGPGYGSYPTGYSPLTAGVVVPWINAVKIKWNPRLSRWLVTASVLWYDPTTFFVPVYDDSIGGFIPTGGANIVSWVGTSMTVGTFPGAPAKSRVFQPGMKLMLTDTSLADPVQAVVTIIDVYDAGGPGAGYDGLILDSTNAEVPSITPSGTTAVYPVVREDVLMWTLGQNAMGLSIEDADNVHVENVVIGGGATDIEERWPNMGRPVWQSAGQSFGFPSDVTFGDKASLTRQPQYNHRFMTPAGKVNLPKYTNVTSSGYNPYGRKAPPGAPYLRDRLHNRMGGG